MPRVIGIDPGTVSIDLCGLEDGTVFLDRSFPTAAALSDPRAFLAVLTDAGPLDLIAGPSGYGLPLTRAREATEEDLRLAFLAAEGEAGGIGGLRALARALARSGLPVVLTPGVIHLTSVPEHRKINRVDMGTADKVCVAALAIAAQAERSTRPLDQVSLVLLELGGAFTAAIAVAGGKIVDGAGGSAGPLRPGRGGAACAPPAARSVRAHPRAPGLRARGERRRPGGGSRRGRARGRPAPPARRDDGHPRGPRHGARSSLRSAPRGGPAAPGARLMPRVLIAGVSTRGFAESAARAGYDVVAVDGYGDLDLVARATVVRVARVRGRFSTRAAVAAARALECDAVVYEASFENDPRAVRALTGPRPLWGNGPAALARARDPRRLARVAAAAGLPAPRLRFSRPPVDAAWLVKPLRSGGRAGVVRWRPRARLPRGCYVQQRIAGVTGSIVFAAHGRRPL